MDSSEFLREISRENLATRQHGPIFQRLGARPPNSAAFFHEKFRQNVKNIVKIIFDIKEENSSKFVYFQATQCRTPFDLTNFFLKNFKQF